jgi:hypothetical protein
VVKALAVDRFLKDPFVSLVVKALAVDRFLKDSFVSLVVKALAADRFLKVFLRVLRGEGFSS